MRWTIVCIAACWLTGADARADVPAAAGAAADSACAACHPVAARVLDGPMATRAAERDFCRRAFGDGGRAFFDQACVGCHLSSCRDCHAADAHADPRPADDACLRCHRGIHTGWEYAGRAPREDHERYRRGPQTDGEHYLQMLPDVHHEAGLGCADCHTLHGADGHGAVRTCRDCHARPSPDVPEHAIAAHLERMECWACHAAWGAQEYGTFFIHAATEEQQEAFAPLPALGPWRRSAALRRQDPPPLGLDARGLVAPIRPQFILLATDLERGWENRLLAAEWRPFVPHTVRRGAVTCGGCHENPRRFVLEDPADRIYELEKDGIPLRSWWDQTGQQVRDGAFFTRERFDLMNRRTPAYLRAYLRQWQELSRPDATSSGR